MGLEGRQKTVDGGGAPRRKGCVETVRHIPVICDKTTHLAVLCASCKIYDAILCRSWRPESCIAILNKKNGGGGDSFFPSPALRVLPANMADRRQEREGRTYGPCTPVNSSSILLPSSSPSAETFSKEAPCQQC
ncbi:hypothetical protein GGP41_009301 [Bipolaris sorokiniana]|uniref:Uncharacterized protein n=1 Tax=Cochliobolus sativus TaxID=45130 RepID=A0A8H6DU59_COCSA|nr:hypothetical protein GGP41_009301 [Bipolaris sorokiniana]